MKDPFAAFRARFEAVKQSQSDENNFVDRSQRIDALISCQLPQLRLRST
jgi:hypothetical protein